MARPRNRPPLARPRILSTIMRYLLALALLLSSLPAWAAPAVGEAAVYSATRSLQPTNALTVASITNVTVKGTLKAHGALLTNLTASLPVETDGNKNLVSGTVTGTGAVVKDQSPTIVTPTIASMANANHNHQDAAGGGALSTAALTSGTLAVARGGTGLASGTSGGIPAYTASGTITSSAALAANAVVIGGGAGAVPATTTTAAGFLAWLATPSSANLITLLSDETGTGAAVFAGSPAFTGNPTAPTQSAGNNSTRLATTAYVDTAVAGASAGNWVASGTTNSTLAGGALVNNVTATQYVATAELRGIAPGILTIANTNTITTTNNSVDAALVVGQNLQVLSNATVAGTAAITGVLTQTGNIELNHASANTLSASSGNLSIEGNVVVRQGHTLGGEVTGTFESDGSTATVIADSVTVATWTMTGAPGLSLNNGATSAGEFRILEDSDDGSNYASFSVPALAANTVYTLPPNDGSSGQVLHTDGNGVLTWDSDDGAGGGAPTDADYLVGTASGSLSAEIVVGTSPGGELGGTWGSPTIDDGITLSGITLQGTTTLGTLAGALDAGGATSFEIPNGNDPDVDAEGEMSYDANGDYIRGFDGTQQVALGRKFETFQATIIAPNDLADAQRDAFFFFSNNSGMSFVITEWFAWSTSDDTDLNIETTANDGSSNATVDAVTIATNGTGIFTGTDATITAGTIANGSVVWLDFDDTDTPALVHMTVKGYYAADVN